MKNHSPLIGLPLKASIYGVIACMCFTVLFCGCSTSADEHSTEMASYPVVVYDDGVYAVECTDLVVTDNGEGTENAAVCLRVTNNSTESVVLSSVLGIRVSADGNPGQMRTVAAGKTPLDGLIDAGNSREGWIAVEVPVGVTDFTVEIAVDYLGDQWITFSVSR